MSHLRSLPIVAGAFAIGCGVGAAILAGWAWWETEGRFR